MIKRIILDIVIVILVIKGIWIIALPLALIHAWFFRLPVEIIAWGIVYDALFGLQNNSAFISHIGTFLGLVFFAIVLLFKSLMRR